jgi:membrane-associated HD superfamily phosphohydrolase
VNPYLLGGIIVYILTIIVAAIAQRLTPYYDDCPVCFFLMLSTPWLLFMLYAYHAQWYFAVSASFFMLVVTLVISGPPLIIYYYRERESIDPEHKGIKVGDP